MSDILSLYLSGFMTYILPPVVAITVVYLIGRMRAKQMDSAEDSGRFSGLHSRPTYHGSLLALMTFLPALLAFCAWSIAEGPIVDHLVNQTLPERVISQEAGEFDLSLSAIKTIENGITSLNEEELSLLQRASKGNEAADPVTPEAVRNLFESKNIIIAENPQPYMIKAAIERYDLFNMSLKGKYALLVLMIVVGFVLGFINIKPRMRARNKVEHILRGFLISASVIAIFTTFGIVLSVLFETIHFFQVIPPSNFFFGMVWDPRFGGSEGDYGQFGFLPLLWGTLYISFVALLVAVPVGLFAAIYMSEYAGPKLRAVVKPALEILAGIPTIVYGFFALVTVGPFFRDAGAVVGLEINASSVLTAGFVMGIMIIPFVSSLSDDIIMAVPQSLREGSLGLGSTKSETIKKVVLPAALPGLVGAVMLAASRAIGETMIVVLAAGIAAKLHMNPFDALTTITVKIVNQLTGDHEFGSPETLVAFALGLSLFVITLALNVYALYIVRKYREQYD